MKRASRSQPQQIQLSTGPLSSLDASGGTAYYGNAAHLLSMMNRKAYYQVSKSGHLKNYGIDVQLFNCVNATATVYTAPTAYPTYNATRAWHFARKDRFSKAGFNLSELGFGERLRFALDKTMSDYDQSTSTAMIKPSNLDHTQRDKGEWDWSDVIITPPVHTGSTTSHSITVGDATDSFVLHLCGDHTVDTGEADETIQYTHVGMIQSWTENRRGWATPDAEETVQKENPLAFARASDLSSYALTSEVEDEQKQNPPYHNEDDDDDPSVFAETIISGTIESKFPNPTTNNDLIIAPGGVFKIHIQNNDSSAAFPQLQLRIYELD